MNVNQFLSSEFQFIDNSVVNESEISNQTIGTMTMAILTTMFWNKSVPYFFGHWTI